MVPGVQYVMTFGIYWTQEWCAISLAMLMPLLLRTMLSMDLVLVSLGKERRGLEREEKDGKRGERGNRDGRGGKERVNSSQKPPKKG